MHAYTTEFALVAACLPLRETELDLAIIVRVACPTDHVNPITPPVLLLGPEVMMFREICEFAANLATTFRFFHHSPK